MEGAYTPLAARRWLCPNTYIDGWYSGVGGAATHEWPFGGNPRMSARRRSGDDRGRRIDEW
jgi:hypothetical protein